MKHLIIADTQVKPGHSMDYLEAIGKYIAAKKPDVIIHIGDHFDFESLSSYDKGKKSFEGRRLVADLEAGHEGMRKIMEPIWKLQANQRKRKKKAYDPKMVFCLGNHEYRADRFANDNPEFEGFVGSKQLDLEQYGWEVFDYVKPAVVDGINYVHFLANPFTGKPYGGNALNQLKAVGCSFVCGHKQLLDCAIRPTLEGKMQIGIINGACYPFDEPYKGHQGNYHFRGLTMLHEVKDGFGCPTFVSLDFIMDKYGKEN